MKVKAQVKERERVLAEARQVSIIDSYGRVDEEIKKLTKIKEGLREKLLNEYGIGVHQGNDYTITVDNVQSIVLDPVKVARKIGVKEALRIASISVEKARALMGADVETCVSEIKETFRVSVKKNA